MSRPSGGKPGYFLLTILVLFTVTMATIPFVEYAQAQDRDRQTAVVDDVYPSGSRGPGNTSRDGRTADFHLADGTTGSVYLGKEANQPDPGETITVYWHEDRWKYTSDSPLTALIWQLAFAVLGAAGIVLWFRLRRRTTREERAEREAAEDPDPYQYRHPHLGVERVIREHDR